MLGSHLLAFNLVLLAALASPGPALLLAMKTTLASGRWAGIATGLGLGAMAALWTAAGLLGLEAILAVFPWAYVALKTGGALYLAYIAYGMWRDAKQPIRAAVPDATRLRHAFVSGVLVNAGTPKSVLFAASVLVVIFPPDITLADKALIVANRVAVEALAYSLFAFALSTGPGRAGYLSLKSVIDRTAALILAALGLRLHFSR